MHTSHSKHLAFCKAPRYEHGKGRDVLAGWHVHVRSLFYGICVGLFQKRDLTLNEKALIPNPVHAVIWNSCPRWRTWLVINRYTVVGFLPVCNVEYQERLVDGDVTLIHGFTSGSTAEVDFLVLLTSHASGRFEKMEFFIRCRGCWWNRWIATHSVVSLLHRDLLPLLCVILLWQTGGKRYVLHQSWY